MKANVTQILVCCCGAGLGPSWPRIIGLIPDFVAI